MSCLRISKLEGVLKQPVQYSHYCVATVLSDTELDNIALAHLMVWHTADNNPFTSTIMELVRSSRVSDALEYITIMDLAKDLHL